MNKFLLSFGMLLFSFSIANAAGLSGGEQFSTQKIEGRLSVQCMSNTPGPTSGSAICRGEILNPGEYSYFVGPKIDADTVTLRAIREDGSESKTKSEKYDGSVGKSKKSFNLWISTVLQRPLLGFGKNTVKYKLSKEGITVEAGEFIVNVVDGGKSVCQRTGYYTSTMSSDCSMPQNLCSRYFSENNYCQ
ncbi:MAG: hypothetical protein WC635_14655 [Bacteriovorax sp.]|jgi:hypothetical protein